MTNLHQESELPGPGIGLGSTGPHLRLVLDGTKHDPNAEPYIAFESSGPGPRLLAEVYVGDAPSGVFVEILLEPHQYDEARGASAAEAITNLQLARSWAAGFAAARAGSVRGLGSIEPLASPARVTPGAAPHHPPVALCRKTGRYIRPACPETLGPLVLCRDEALLRRSGLPPYADSAARFLYSPRVAEQPGRPVTFYTYSLQRIESSGSGARIRHRGEVFRDLLPRIQDGSAEPAGGHPCFTCEHKSRCYPAGSTLDAPIPAEDQIVPIAYYGSDYVPLVPMPLGFEESATLLGGGSLPASTSARLGAYAPGREILGALASPYPQFFFEGDRTGLFAVECLYLKMAAFTEILRGLLDLQREIGRPHLGLTPARLSAQVRALASHVPARWGIQMKIHDAVSTAPLAMLEPDRVPDEPTVWAIPQPRLEPYLPASMLKPQVLTLSMRLDGPRLTVQTEGPNLAHLVLEARLASDHYVPADHGRQDLVRVVAPTTAHASGRLVFGGSKSDGRAGSFLFRGRTRVFSLEEARRVEQRGLEPGSVDVTLARTFGAAADLVALGRLFLRFLFWNDAEDGPLFGATKIDRVAARLSDIGTPLLEVQQIRSASEAEGLPFEAARVLFRAEDRKNGAAVPDALWAEVLLLAYRTATTIPGFSWAGALDDYPESAPFEPIARALRAFEGLTERTRGSLIGSSGRNRVMLEVCHDFLDDLKEATAPRDDVSGGSAEATMVFVRRP